MHYSAIISLEKRRVPLLIKLEFPSPKHALCQVWLILLRSFGEEDKNVKSLQTHGRTDSRTDGGTTDTRGSEKHRSSKLAIITITNSAIIDDHHLFTNFTRSNIIMVSHVG